MEAIWRVATLKTWGLNRKERTKIWEFGKVKAANYGVCLEYSSVWGWLISKCTRGCKAWLQSMICQSPESRSQIWGCPRMSTKSVIILLIVTSARDWQGQCYCALTNTWICKESQLTWIDSHNNSPKLSPCTQLVTATTTETVPVQRCPLLEAAVQNHWQTLCLLPATLWSSVTRPLFLCYAAVLRLPHDNLPNFGYMTG